VVKVHCHIQNNFNIFIYFGSKLEKLGTIPAASWFKNKHQVLFRFSAYFSWFSRELLWRLDLHDLGKLIGKEGIKRQFIEARWGCQESGKYPFPIFLLKLKINLNLSDI